jgi:hypothetical protein
VTCPTRTAARASRTGMSGDDSCTLESLPVGSAISHSRARIL